MKRPLLLLLGFVAVAHAQNSAPIVLNPPLSSATVYANAGPLVIDLTTAFQDPDLTRAVRLTTVEGIIDLAVYDRQKPITATNFFRYVSEGRYFMTDPTTMQRASSFIHRSVANFVLQGGGFIATVNPNDPAKEQVQPSQVATLPPIQNEPGISNKRGTVAMAKLGGDPNSATSQWFINLSDNSANLDTQNGGFTVFARVIGDGMNVADRIAGIPVVNAGSPFDSLPVRNYTAPNTYKVANLVLLPDITEIAAVHSPLDFTVSTNNSGVVEPVVSATKLYVRGKSAGSANVTVTATDLDGASVSQTFSVTVIDPPSRFANIATRMEVRPDPNQLIGGFYIRGTGMKRLIVRATIPSNFSNTLADPQLELYDSGGNLLASNDNWGDATKQDIIDTRIPPNTAKESALIATLPATSDGAGYTAMVRGANSGIGIALVEVYDLDSGPGSTLVNIATRGRVDTDPKVMIGGFILTGTGSKKVFIRALGPSLPVSGTLADPKLELFDANGDVLASNDDWQSSPDSSEIAASVLKPGSAKESAIIRTLTSAGYTAVVSGVNGAKGVATVEVYEIQ